MATMVLSKVGGSGGAGVVGFGLLLGQVEGHTLVQGRLHVTQLHPIEGRDASLRAGPIREQRMGGS